MFHMPWMDFVILVLASFRLTRLFVFDEITAALREPFLRLVKEKDETGRAVHRVEVKGTGWRRWVGRLLSCYWCVGIWSSLFLLFLYYGVPASAPLLLLLAVAGAASILETRLFL